MPEKKWKWGFVYGPYAARWIRAYLDCLLENRPVSKLPLHPRLGQGNLF